MLRLGARFMASPLFASRSSMRHASAKFQSFRDAAFIEIEGSNTCSGTPPGATIHRVYILEASPCANWLFPSCFVRHCRSSPQARRRIRLHRELF
jgi:hypothetical protein